MRLVSWTDDDDKLGHLLADCPPAAAAHFCVCLSLWLTDFVGTRALERRPDTVVIVVAVRWTYQKGKRM